MNEKNYVRNKQINSSKALKRKATGRQFIRVWLRKAKEAEDSKTEHKSKS
jgi:hypothetical protein